MWKPFLKWQSNKKTGSCHALIVTGCMAQRYQKEIIEEVPEVDAVLGTTSYGDIVKALEEAVAGNHFEEFRDIDYLPDTGSKRVLTTGGHFGYLRSRKAATSTVPTASSRSSEVNFEAFLWSASLPRQRIWLNRE